VALLIFTALVVGLGPGSLSTWGMGFCKQNTSRSDLWTGLCVLVIRWGHGDKES
jgi:hypothetical protein